MNVPTPGRCVRPGCGQSALQLVASRYEIGSIMLTSNLPFGKAHLLVGTSDLRVEMARVCALSAAQPTFQRLQSRSIEHVK